MDYMDLKLHPGLSYSWLCDPRWVSYPLWASFLAIMAQGGVDGDIVMRVLCRDHLTGHSYLGSSLLNLGMPTTFNNHGSTVPPLGGLPHIKLLICLDPPSLPGGGGCYHSYFTVNETKNPAKGESWDLNPGAALGLCHFHSTKGT